MEDMIFGLFLFVIYYCFLYWLILDTSEEVNTADDTAWDMNQDSNIVLHIEEGQVTTITPIERQLHDVLWESDEVIETVIEVTQGQLTPNILESVEVDKITLRSARKIAKALGIKQKVRGKDLFCNI